jgi:uncharacterized protein (DUF58 family)
MPRRRYHFLMLPLEHGFIRGVDDRYRGWFTPAGRMMLWAGIASGTLLLGGLVPTQMMVFGMLLSLCVLALVLGSFFRPRVRLSRQLGAFPSAGQTWTYRVRVENVGRFPLYNGCVEERGLPFEVRPDGEPPNFPTLMPGASTTVTVSLRCSQRGAYDLRTLQCSSSFPAGLLKWSSRVKTLDQVLVYPAYKTLTEFAVPHGRNYQPGGMSVASHVGDSPEFVGLRGWREGDRVRDIHWPTVARTGQLTVREHQEEYFVRLALVLDVEVRRAADEKLLEAALSVGASVADALARQDYIVDIFAAGTQVHQFRAGRALMHMENILHILASLEGGDRLDVTALEAALLPEAERLSAAVLVVMDWDEHRARLVASLRSLGVAVRVLCVRPGKELVGLAPDEVVTLP